MDIDGIALQKYTVLCVTRDDEVNLAKRDLLIQ
jgi:hypothetical protein